MDDAQLLAEFEDLLRTMPSPEVMRKLTVETYAWFGRARAIVGSWDKIRAVFFAGQVDEYLASINSAFNSDLMGLSPLPKIIALIQEARFDLRMKTTGPLSVAVNRGQPFDYFDEVRKLIAAAQSDILFVDPYLDADFVSRYLPHIRSGVTIRLLASKNLAVLLPAAQQFAQQHKASVEVRKTAGRPHDRYVFVDKGQCYLSSASFQDGGRLSPATLQQISDASAELLAMYEGEWGSATVERRP
jgi:hypothetical protein